MQMRKGTPEDIDEVSALYDDLNDYLENHTNYPGWRKGIYPAREDAVSGIEEKNLFVAVEDGKIVGTVILRHQPEKAYELVDWKSQLDYSEIFVIYTFAVHPQFLGNGIGKKMMEFILSYAKEQNMKAVRLDVYEKICRRFICMKAMDFSIWIPLIWAMVCMDWTGFLYIKKFYHDSI